MCKNNRRKKKIYIYLYGVEFNNCDYVLKEHLVKCQQYDIKADLSDLT